MSIADEVRAEVEKALMSTYRSGYIDGASRKPEAAPSDTDREVLAELQAAFDAAGRMPQGTMTHEQWKVFARLYNATERVIDSQPVQVEVTDEAVTVMAKYMSAAASDWNHNDCGFHDHDLHHTNWEAYTDDARRALVAALGGGDQ